MFIRYMAAAEIAARLRYKGESLTVAATDMVAELAQNGGDGGLIALGAQGQPVLPFNSAGMYRGWADAQGRLYTSIYREPFTEG